MTEDLVSLAVIVGLGLLTGVGLVLYFRARRKRWERDRAVLQESIEADLTLPPTIHPVVDPALCMGSGACVKACPEKGILGIVDGKAVLISPTQCIGHSRCEAVCPVDAIKLVFGTEERGIDLPQLDGDFETARKGVHIVGELAGMGLIKNAMTQGLQVGETLHKRLNGQRSKKRWDVAIVGAGPAGIGAALACRAAGLSFTVVDQDTVGGTVAHYPRQKVVMTEQLELPIYGRFGRSILAKEELLEELKAVMRAAEINVYEKARVTGIEGGDGEFRLQTSRGAVDAAKVVLALGRRGSPRKLGVPGEDLEKVTYRLIDPDQYNGKHVMIVGGGDSAVEAACQLAEQSSAKVAISYRKPMFARCRAKNRDHINRLIEQGRIQAVMSSNIKQVTPDGVLLEQNGKSLHIPNDFLIVNAGGVLPTQFLKDVGVEIETHMGDTAKQGRPKINVEESAPTRLGFALAFFGIAITALLVAMGLDYYMVPVELRPDHPQHELLKPSGLWGHGVGVVATAVMLLNFLYAVRKRVKLFGKIGTMRDWMTFHVFVGVMSPIVIAFHAAFQSNNLLATATAGSLAIVVGTGLVGRFFFSFLPTARGKVLRESDIKKQWQELMKAVHFSEGTSTNVLAVARMSEELMELPEHTGGAIALAMRLPFQRLHARRRVKKARHFFRQEHDFHMFRASYTRLSKLWLQAGFYEQIRRLMTVWRVFHVVLSILLVLIMAGHIALSLYLGYGWIFFG